MISRLPDITQNIDPNEPFKNCALGRYPYAKVLTNIVRNTNEGVISLNGDWGSGKTTFIKMWNAHLLNECFTTLYFNVWDNDYSEDPMISLMSQLYGLFKSTKHKKQARKVLNSFGKVLINLGKPLLKGLIKKFTGTDLDGIIDGLKDATDASIDELANIAEKAMDKVSHEKEDLEVFKKALECLVNSTSEESGYNTSDKKPIVCFIDELDRCNPRYAVQVLERIKHMFSVPGIVFVLSIDKTQLGNSIRGFYGSDLINAEEYLRRFIDLDLKLPPIDSDKFFEYLYQAFRFKDIFAKRRGREILTELDNFKIVGELLLDRSNITLRQAEKMMSHLHLVLSSLSPTQSLMATNIVVLVFLRITSTQVYEKILNKKYTIQELVSVFEEVFSSCFQIKNFNETPVRIFTYALAEIVCMYNATEHEGPSEKLMDSDGAEDVLTFNLTIIPKDIFRDAISWEERTFRFGVPPLRSVMQNIELINNMIY